MIFSRAFRALMRRNVLYRIRNWIGTILELFLPVIFVVFLLLIKNAVERSDDGLDAEIIPAYFPNETDSISTFSFGDYVTAIQAKRQCVEATEIVLPEEYQQYQDLVDQYQESQGLGDLEISGIFQQGYNWQVPFVKCDSRKCEEVGEDASTYCQYFALGLAPSSATDAVGLGLAEEFRDYIYNRYPILNDKESRPFDNDFVQMFDSNEELGDYVTTTDYSWGEVPKLALGVVFNGIDPDINYNYAIRVNSTNYNDPAGEEMPGVFTTPRTEILLESYTKTDSESCTIEDGGPNIGKNQDSCTYQYIFNGALVIQRLIGDWIMEKEGAKDKGFFVSEHGVQYAPFPSSEYEDQGFFADIAPFVPLFVALGLLYPVAAMIRYVTLEKELRQKELMKMMSVAESDIGWSWFLTFETFHIITATASAGVMAALYENSSYGILWIFWVLTMTAVIVFSTFLASLFSKATRATLVGILLFFAGYFLTLIVDYDTGETGTIAFISLHPVAAFAYGVQEIGRLEDAGVGITSSTYDTTDSPSGYTFSNTISNLFIDCIVWGVLTWYLNRVVPSDYGQPMPWFFPFTQSYWCPDAGAIRSGDIDEFQYDETIPVEQVSDEQKEQTREKESIEIRNLKKTFGDKTAVDGLSMSMYKNQVTALLGHNGAGKTTLISMLTGMFAPTDGYATIAGKDIRTHMTSIRQEIGICLQHDCLFPMLTVREHMQFFSRVKGVYGQLSHGEAEGRVDASLKDVALFEKRNTLSKNLSGGMKRKLSVAIAFCGDSKTVFLDEPTSGMDPFARRFTWNVIRQYRQDRRIILTTHFMDEADILGDSIAIMAEGRLRCLGSSLFLKKTYGVGYQLTIEKQPADVIGERVDEIDGELAAIVRRAVPNSSLLSDVGTELSFQLPIGAAPHFKPMFEGLDRAIGDGSIVTYGVGITTLDEVFLLVARGDEAAEARRSSVKLASSRRDFGKLIDVDIEDENMTEKSVRSRMELENDKVFHRHMRALFLKRALNFRRDKKAWLCTTILPSLFVFIGLILFKFVTPDRNLEPLTLDIDDYNTEISGNQRNPVPFNAPDSSFICQPQSCIYDFPVVVSQPTEEVYYYCGSQAYLDSKPECSIADSENVMEYIQDGGAFGVPQDVVNASEASYSLFDSSSMFSASQYGALYFTHEALSTINDMSQSMYNTTAINECLGRFSTYGDAQECYMYGGLGYTIRYNFTALHIAPTMQALADEAIIRYANGDDGFRIVATIDPLPLTAVEETFGQVDDAFPLWFLITLSFPFIMGSFGTFVVAERENKAKHLQTVAGVEPSAYWLSTWLWDVANYQIPCWITVILIYAFDIGIMTTRTNGIIGGVLSLFVLFGPAAASFTYCVSFLFTSPSICNLVVIITSFLIALGGTLAAFILRLLGEDPGDPNSAFVSGANAIEAIFRFFPPFCLSKGLYNLAFVETFEYFEGEPITVWHTRVLLWEVVFLAWESVVYLYLAIKLDHWSNNPSAVQRWRTFLDWVTLRKCFCPRAAPQSLRDTARQIPDDDDVLTEQDRVLQGEANGDLVVLNQLTKVYENGKLAVDNISFGIPHGQCFGLLGINGAGKTTTLAMLTCEFPPTSGDATLAGFSIAHEPEKTRRRIGYCPQFDAHFMNMTGREHVELYAKIKGVPRDILTEVAAAKLAEVGLSVEDSDRLSAGYSGGMKRRLSLACATIGQPQIVFLDECSTGVDPVARREIWQMVSNMVTGNGHSESSSDDEKTSVILTTHSMEEAEALCSRIAIMAGGKIRCLGSAQHLKDKFGQGYQVELKIRNPQRSDPDYQAYLQRMVQGAALESPDDNGDSESPNHDRIPHVFLTWSQTQAALSAATGDSFLTDKIRQNDPTGYGIYKDASSPSGVELHDLVHFATRELRMRTLASSVQDRYPQNVLRERQYNKVRYEVSSEGIRIADIFEWVEENKVRLAVEEYSASQTSLEQVFNMHAAEAEKLKEGTTDT